MIVWAIADLHLSIGVPEKKMDIFGPQWANYMDKIAESWHASVKEGDLVLIPGDISWAMKLEQAVKDLEWIDKLPGTKVMIRGNHDYWWSSLSKVRSILPPSCHVIQNDVFTKGGVSVAGARFWDDPAFNFSHLFEASLEPAEINEKIYKRELERLEMSLKQLDQEASVRLAMTHYPPISADLQPSKASALFEKYGVQIALFGHLHNIQTKEPLFGSKNGVEYILTAADYLDFKLRKVFEC